MTRSSIVSGIDPWSFEIGGQRVTFGLDAIDGVGDAVDALGCRNVLVVTDPGVRDAGHADRAVHSLAARGVRVTVFDDVRSNPTSSDVARGTEFASGIGPDGLVAVGGGSAMDTAKGINFVLSNGGTIDDYHGFGKATRPMLPSVGIPTTAGSGSEAQSYALVSADDTRVKMACGDPGARFRAVVLDPSLTATQPHSVAAANGIDAVAHAVESFVTTRRNPLSQLFAREAWRLLESSLDIALSDHEDERARGRTQAGAFFAGLAIEYSMLGAAHACANPLTARFGVTHGLAVGLMLPAVIRFNAVEHADLYEALHAGTVSDGRGATLEHRVQELRADAGIPVSLRDVSIPEGDLDRLAEDASRQWTSEFNPTPVTSRELRAIYASAY